MPSFKKYRFCDFVDINPLVRLKSNDKYSFIEMKDLNDGQRYAYPSIERTLTGGARFEEGDTLFARITPCLENGKICQAKGLKDGKGFGSTEFLVFRGKEAVSDSNFVYYLSRWDEVRRFAELNMVGTSGRQRVPKDVFENLELELPEDLPTQTRIASILSALDDKIELNRRTNRTLEQMAQTLFKKYFVTDIDPDNLPEGWRREKLGHHIDTISKTHKFPTDKIIFLNTSDILGGKVLVDTYSDVDTLPGQAKKSIQKNDILFSEIRPGNKRFAYINFEADDYVVSTKLMVLRSKKMTNSLFFYFLLTREEMLSHLQNLAEARSGTFPQITFDQIREIDFLLPDNKTLNNFIEKTLEPTYNLIFTKEKEIETLSKIRDTLLPKLMNGEINVN